MPLSPGSRLGAYLVPAVALAIAALLLAASPVTRAAEGPADGARPPRTDALLINGGGSAAGNYLSHLHHLQDMVAALKDRGVAPENMHIFSADGEDPKDDLAARGPEDPSFWLIDGTDPGRALNRTDLQNTVWKRVKLKPARLTELRRWFVSMSGELQPGDTLLVFVTDHGMRNQDDPDNGLISLWNESLSVLEFRALLGHLRPGVRVINVMSQCYSGAFADVMSPFYTSEPTGDVCGFYSTTGDRQAFGCYPEGRDRDRFGHAFRFIDAMNRHPALDEAHIDTLVGDTTPDVPLRTSDVFLERTLSAEAARAEVALDVLVDEQLALAWKNPSRFEPQIRLLDRIGEVYGTFSPRSLAELKPRVDGLQLLYKELETYDGRWRLTLDDARIENLKRFEEQDPSWNERLNRGLSSLGGDEKRATLTELLAALAPFTESRGEVWTRLGGLRRMHAEAQAAKYRVDVRLAALLRMRTTLVSVAGEHWLEDAAAEAADGTPADAARRAQRRALAALEACERTPIGVLDPAQVKPADTVETLPPLDEDLQTLLRVLPSWLGIRFGPVAADEQQRRKLERGAAKVEQVFAGSPADAAGMRVGDILLGPPGHRFLEPNEVREWIMNSPREESVKLKALRGDEEIEFDLALTSYPRTLVAPPAPPKAGDPAPPLEGLQIVRMGPSAVPDWEQRRHLLFFWATWCGPCKASLPELADWSKHSGVPVLAVSDEDPLTLKKFLDGWSGPFPERVASDGLRASHLSYGVSGTPTFVLVDAQGKIEWRQVGYSKETGLAVPGWTWSAPGK